MPNFEDILIANGETPDAFYECTTCLKMQPPFVLDEDQKCSTCYIDEARGIEQPITIEELRQNKKAEITQWRNERDNGGAITALGTMDSDQVSIMKITGAVQMAQIALMAGQPFSITWTMKDNVSVEHSAEEMIAAGVAVGQFIASNHATSVALKAQAEAAETEEDLALITWP